ncbi:MAG: hypothetical protein ACTHK2_14315, partial [Dokdonella sp.]|uniref:hypothetical protein n=1 Tax=Dokdonella sp. TaxID=2291710 RepID=UPI003F8234CF
MKRLFRTALAIAVAGVGLQFGAAQAAVVCSAPINHAIAANLNGTSVNWITGDVQDADIAAYNFNAWATGGNLAFFWESSTDNAGVSATANGAYLVLAPGATISSSSLFSRSTSAANAANWRQAANVDGYMGFKFNCSSLGVPAPSLCFGYVHMTTTGTTGFPATIVDYCYENTGAAITISAGPVTHTVTPSVGTPSGSISPNTAQVVNDGATTAFTLTPDTGFHIDTVGGTCGGSLAGNTYTTNAVTADCTVVANFAADGGGGTFPPDENFDEVTAPALPAGWVTSTTTGTDFTTVTTASDTAPNAAFATDLPSVNDFTLDSPAFTPL